MISFKSELNEIAELLLSDYEYLTILVVIVRFLSLSFGCR